MDIQVLEGSLVEAPTAEGAGMDRRALGEFVGPRGELASYAFGWTTGSQPHVARLSIGIGAGNPGGGTFHAVVFQHQGGHAFSLTDERFERVPQGGPTLIEILDLRPGSSAQRTRLGEPWTGHPDYPA